MREFTKSELIQYDGKEGKRCFVAVNKVVYDVTDSDLWQDGKHMMAPDEALCGRDLTAIYETHAPESHREGHFRLYPKMGKLIDGQTLTS